MDRTLETADALVEFVWRYFAYTPVDCIQCHHAVFGPATTDDELIDLLLRSASWT
jgi:hypothetical protein